MTDRLTGTALPLRGLILLARNPVEDARGSLQRLYCSDVLSGLGVNKPIVQINLTKTVRRGAIRGMHFQHPPHAETKIVTCLRGRVFDVAVDLRRNSPSFLQWYGEELSPERSNSLVIPEGFAHGFQALSDDCEMLYFHTAAYCAVAEAGVRPTDPALAIAWPLSISEISDRDANHSLLSSDYAGITV
jgi:dTDP-4-dehydrorhamnose 3,5-epimerase